MAKQIGVYLLLLVCTFNLRGVEGNPLLRLTLPFACLFHLGTAFSYWVLLPAEN